MKSKTVAALLLVMVFLLGGVTGGVIHYLYRSRVSAASNQPGHRYTAGEIAQEIAQALQLDEKQKESLQVILKQSRDRYRALSTQYHQQFEALRNETHEQIRQILREDQKPRFETFLKDLEKRRREHQQQGR